MCTGSIMWYSHYVEMGNRSSEYLIPNFFAISSRACFVLAFLLSAALNEFVTCVGGSKALPVLYIRYTVSVHIMANNARSLLAIMHASGR